MATEQVDEEEVDKHKDQNDELTLALNEIITQNLTIGVSKLGDDTDDLIMDDHVDMKSNASCHWRRGSVSYSQPNSPKGNPSLSPVSSVSSISELSTEYQSNSESCASLNSATSNDSFGAMLHDLINKEVIHEHKENCPPLPITNNNTKDDQQEKYHQHDDIQKTQTPKKKKKNKLNHSKTNNKKHSKTSLDIATKKKKKHKKNKGSYSLSKSISHDTSINNKRHKHKHKHKKSPKPKMKRRNSKDCLDITQLSRLSTKSIETWSISEVVEWVKLIDNGKYKEYAEKFQSKKIDGKKLYKMNRAMLQSIQVYHPSARKAILAALQKLKAKVEISFCILVLYPISLHNCICLVL